MFTLELTHAWNDLLPLRGRLGRAYALSALLLKRSVLTEKIARRRLHLTREYTTDPLESFFAREVMNHEPVLLRESDRIVDVLSVTRYAHLYPVLDEDDRLVGVTTRRALMECDAARVGDATSAPRAISHPDDTLRQVANNLAAAEVTRAPVVDRAEPDRVLGVITLAQLLHARRRDLHEEHHRERLLIIRDGQTEVAAPHATGSPGSTRRSARPAPTSTPPAN